MTGAESVSAPRAAGPRPGERADIQGLRALAVLLVILNHAGLPVLPGGYVGVDVFFVVSGYLISSLLLREASTTGRLRIGAFYARRARRILPAATLVLVATTLFTALELSLARVEQIVDDALWSAFFLANVHFAQVGTDYFAQTRSPSPLEHFWSLAVEEQFYLVWPAVLAVLLLAGVRLSATGMLARVRGRVPVASIAVFAALALSLAWSILLTSRSPVPAYFSTLTRAWELATGALLALSGVRLHSLGLQTRRLLAAAGIASVLVAAITFDASTAFPGWRALLPVLGTAALLAAGAGGPSVGAGRMLTLRPLPWIGDLSYSLYLWHWPVLVLGREYLAGPDSVAQTSLLLCLALAAAGLSYSLVENPIRRSRGVLAHGSLGLVLWPTAIATVLVSCGWSQQYATEAMQARIEAITQAPAPAPAAAAVTSGRAARPGAGTSSVPAPRQRPPPSVRDLIVAALRQTDQDAPIPFPLVNYDLLRGDVWQQRFRCASGWESTTADLCPVGDLGAPYQVVLYGDSHAGMWLPSLSTLGEQHHYRVTPLVKFGCVPFDVRQRHAGHDFPECPAFRTWALGQIRRIKPDVILLAYRGLWSVDPGPGQDEAEAWTAGVDSGVRRLRRLAPIVTVISDIPSIPTDPAECITDPHASMRACTADDASAEIDSNRLTRRAVMPLGVSYVDVTGLVCRRHRCPLVVDHTITYHDDSHITMTWGKRVTPAFGRLIALPGGR